MSKVNQNYINSIVKLALEEDLKPLGDITTKLISSKDKKILPADVAIMTRQIATMLGAIRPIVPVSVTRSNDYSRVFTQYD